ncbi:hypothetical protein EDC04DRAFT_2609639 [Pisolithus marmoratus]|nr:hypothetical protein EDC04DRAFT_2609639 [Pisolithus marmoratus]
MTYQISSLQLNVLSRDTPSYPICKPPSLCMKSKSVTKRVQNYPFLPLDSQDDLLPEDALGHFIYTQLPSPQPVHQQSPITVRTLKSNNNDPDTGANTTGKLTAGLKRQWEEETDPQLQTPWQFGNGLTNTQHMKTASPLQPANKHPGLAKHWI